jgi:hypothetical protein
VCDRDGSRPELVFCAVPVQGVPQTPAEDGRLEWACLILLAGGLGFEPRLTESESAVLPLNYPPIMGAPILHIGALRADIGPLPFSVHP